MRRVLTLAAALLAVSALPAEAHNPAVAAHLGVEVQAALAQAGVVPDSPVARLAGPRTLQLAVMPIQVGDAVMPTPEQLLQEVADLNATWAAATGGKLKATAVVAPVFKTTQALDPLDQNHVLAQTIAAAATAHVPMAGATPVFIGASEDLTSSWGGPTLGALLLGTGWKSTAFWAHEIGHWLGLSHGRSPACPTAGSVVGCSEQDFVANEYGDFFDIMGSGVDRYGAFQLRVLGLQAPPEAAPGAAVATIAPPGLPGPQSLRIRTAARDWFVESRTESHYEVFTNTGTSYEPFDIVKPLPVGGVIVSGAARRYVTNETGYFPNPYRYAPDVGAPCDALLSSECGGAAEVFIPGKALTVPGAFRLDVLPAAVDGTSQVRTTWLDPSPPALTSATGRIEKPWGSSASTLVVDLAGRSDGAGIAAVEVKAGKNTTRLDADTLPGLVAVAAGKGKATVRIKAPRSGVVEATLVDAAGKRSAIRKLTVRKLKTTRPNAMALTPRAGNDFSTAPAVRAGTRLKVSVATDPRAAGLDVYVWALGGGSTTPKRVRVSRSGRASTTIALPKGDAIQVVVQVPRRKGRSITWVAQPRAWYHVG